MARGNGEKPQGRGTKAVHGGHAVQPGPLATPIVQTSTFAFASSAEMRRYVEGDEELFLYTRYANPTVRALEESLAALEGAEAALALSSGMAAMTSAMLSLVRAGDEVLGSAALYGGTLRLVSDTLPRFGVGSRLLSSADLLRVDQLATGASRRPSTGLRQSKVAPSAAGRRRHTCGSCGTARRWRSRRTCCTRRRRCLKKKRRRRYRCARSSLT